MLRSVGNWMQMAPICVNYFKMGIVGADLSLEMYVYDVTFNVWKDLFKIC